MPIEFLFGKKKQKLLYLIIFSQKSIDKISGQAKQGQYII